MWNTKTFAIDWFAYWKILDWNNKRYDISIYFIHFPGLINGFIVFFIFFFNLFVYYFLGIDTRMFHVLDED